MSEPHIILVGGDGGPSGVPRHITDLVRALAGHARLTVLSEADRGGYSEITRLGATHVTLQGLATRPDPRRWRQGRAALADWLAQNPATLVWAHARMPVLALRQALVSGQWAPAPGTRIALSYHGLPFGPGHRPGTSPLSRRSERRLLAASPPLDLVFLTGAQRDAMQHAIGAAMATHRTHVLGNASHLGPLPAAEPHAGRHLVMTGRAGWQKNTAAALRLLRHMAPDITLSLCGAGTETPRFAARARTLAGDAADRVRLLGPLHDVRPLLASADGYMLTSRYEGLPIGALEAAECGLPLILAPFDGAKALAHDHPAALMLTGNRPADARAIDALLTRYLADRPAMTRAIQTHWAARYSPDRFATAARALALETLCTPLSPQN